MKPSTKFNVLMLTGCAFMMLGLFSKPLSIPLGFSSIPTLVGIVFIYLAYRISKKAKAGGGSLFPAPTVAQKRKKLGLMIVPCALISVAAPFWLPYTGVTLPFTELIIISVVSFFICVGAVWLGMKMKT